MGGKTWGCGSVSLYWLKVTVATRQCFTENICNDSKKTYFLKIKCHHVITYKFCFIISHLLLLKVTHFKA